MIPRTSVEVLMTSNSKKTFPEVLMEILSLARDDGTVSDVITWLPNGNAFIIFEPDAFAENILPRFFPKTRYASFTRKLNRWGFRQITKGAERGAFQHELFQRDKPDLCRHMTCNKKQKAASSELKAAHISSDLGQVRAGAYGAMMPNNPNHSGDLSSPILPAANSPSVSQAFHLLGHYNDAMRPTPQGLPQPLVGMNPAMMGMASNDFQQMLRYQHMASSALQAPIALMHSGSGNPATHTHTNNVNAPTSISSMNNTHGSSQGVPTGVQPIAQGQIAPMTNQVGEDEQALQQQTQDCALNELQRRIHYQQMALSNLQQAITAGKNDMQAQQQGNLPNVQPALPDGKSDLQAQQQGILPNVQQALTAGKNDFSPQQQGTLPNFQQVAPSTGKSNLPAQQQQMALPNFQQPLTAGKSDMPAAQQHGALSSLQNTPTAGENELPALQQGPVASMLKKDESTLPAPMDVYRATRTGENPPPTKTTNITGRSA